LTVRNKSSNYSFLSFSLQFKFQNVLSITNKG